MTHQVQPGTHDSLGASRAAHLSTLEWEPEKSLGLCRLSATAPVLDEAVEGKEAREQLWCTKVLHFKNKEACKARKTIKVGLMQQPNHNNFSNKNIPLINNNLVCAPAVLHFISFVSSQNTYHSHHAFHRLCEVVWEKRKQNFSGVYLHWVWFTAHSAMHEWWIVFL